MKVLAIIGAILLPLGAVLFFSRRWVGSTLLRNIAARK